MILSVSGTKRADAIADDIKRWSWADRLMSSFAPSMSSKIDKRPFYIALLGGQ
jgi:hypothetical protein